MPEYLKLYIFPIFSHSLRIIHVARTQWKQELCQ